MTSALEKVMKGVLQKSDAQKAFSTWWEDLEDKLLYSLMVYGLILVPFNMVSNTPVECTVDREQVELEALSIRELRLMRQQQLYLRKFCTMFFISDAMVLLPFLLILAPLPLVGITRMCLRLFGVEKRMDVFFQLLLKDSLQREDVDNFEKEKVRHAHEVIQLFRDANGIFYSVLFRSGIQLCIGSIIALTLIWIRVTVLAPENIQCELFDREYVCVVPLSTFYTILLTVSIVSILGFQLCCLCTLLWTMCPSFFNSFHRLMAATMDHVDISLHLENQFGDNKRSQRFSSCISDPRAMMSHAFMENVSHSRDLALLISLLATKHGIAEGLRFVSLFDKEYRQLWRPHQVDIKRLCDEGIKVSFDDAPIAEFMQNYFDARHRRNRNIVIEYTIELIFDENQHHVEMPIRNHIFCPKAANEEEPEDNGVETKFYTETFYLKPKEDNSSKNNKDKFGEEDNKDNVDKEEKERLIKTVPHVIISCEVNGRTIAQTKLKVPSILADTEEVSENHNNGVEKESNDWLDPRVLMSICDSPV